MAVITFIPVTYTTSGAPAITNSQNALTDTSSSNYAIVNRNSATTGTATYYCSFKFDFSEIPDNSTIKKVTAKAKAAYYGGGTSSSSHRVGLRYTDSSALSTVIGEITSSAVIRQASYTNISLETLKSNSFALVYQLESLKDRSTVAYIYGSEIIVEYEEPPKIYNKVEYGDKTLIDLTADTVTPSSLLQGYTAHDNTGALITGTAEIESHGDGDPLGYGTENTLRTVLYTDGTLIINEKSSDIEANVAKHGEATNTYPACDRSTTNNPYLITTASGQPWNSQKSSILNVELGSVVKPIYGTKNWFYGLTNCLSISMKGLDTSCIEGNFSMSSMFCNCYALTSLDLGDKFDTSSVTTMSNMFNGCISLTTIYTKLDFVLYSETVQIFSNDSKLVGGNGTKYTDMTNPSLSVYARIDKSGTPGYFTDRSQKPVS